MRKTIEGGRAVIEGTPAELAEYDRQRDVFAPIAPMATGPGHSPFCELMVVQRGWWSIVPPACTCHGFMVTPRWTYRTTGGAGD